MITVYVHSHGSALESEIELHEISDVLQRDGELLWVDVVAPTAEDLALLKEEFGFHSLAMEDVARQMQRPKIDSYEDHLFLVIYALIREQRDDVTALEVRHEQLSMFVGSNYVVTVHDTTLSVLSEVSARWRQNLQTINHHSVGMLAYSIIDAVVDGYFPLLDEISDRLDDLEEQIFDQFDQKAQQEIFRLKKELVRIRRVVAPERDVLNVLLRRDTPVFDATTIVFFQDVYDHVLRVTDAVDTYRDLLTSALEFHLSIASNRLNQVMKTLTASSIILMGMTLVASVYGMNFEHMPELHWNLGYAWALVLMAGIGSSLFVVFKRMDWF